MTVHFLTMVPSSGDGPYPGSDVSATGGWTSAEVREPNLDYISKIARAAEEGGFQTLLLPVGTFCLDGWVATSFVAQQTTTLRFLVALRPGLPRQPSRRGKPALLIIYRVGGCPSTS